MNEELIERHQIGANNPPADPSDFELIEAQINDLYDEARNWLDGEPVTTQGQADGLNKLIDAISKAQKQADELRKSEVKPFDDAKAAIQSRYNALIGETKSVTGKTVLAIKAAKLALTPWLQKLDAEKREAERLARERAEEAANVAREAHKQADVTDLAAQEEAERLLNVAKQANIEARVAANDKAQAKGSGRATGLRSFWRAEITDKTEFARWAWVWRRPEVDGFFTELADKIVAQNHTQVIPGVIIHEDRKAV